jgi:hypothetical protein
MNPKNLNSIETLNIFPLCSVPEDQKPITEYLQWRKSVISFPVFWPFFLIFGIISILLKTSIFFLFFICFPLYGLFTSLQLSHKFHQARLVYEESSWFDTQVWEKPHSFIRKDKILASQRVLPIQKKLLRIFLFFFVWKLASG